MLETPLLSTHLASPRIGNLEQVFHIFGYLKDSSKLKLGFDSGHLKIGINRFHRFNWMDFYKGVKKAIPLNMLKPHGNSVSTNCFVDANLQVARIKSELEL